MESQSNNQTNNNTITINKPKSEILREYFLAEDIEIIGTIEAPLFVAIDVAKKVGDEEHYARKIMNFGTEFVVEKKHFRSGQKRLMKFFTEHGLHEYLFTLKNNEKASNFRKWTSEILDEVRDKLIEKIELNEHISRQSIINLQRQLSNAKAYSDEMTSLNKRLISNEYISTPENATPRAIAMFYYLKYKTEYLVKWHWVPITIDMVEQDNKMIKKLTTITSKMNYKGTNRNEIMFEIYKLLDGICVSTGAPSL